MFEYINLLGEGAFSKVYRIKLKESGEMLACKVITEKKEADREMRFLSSVNHALFPAYRGCYWWEGKYYLFMEYIAGCTLKELVERRSGLKQKQIVRITEALANGLSHIHEQNPPMLFRDIKPENVMIQQDGRVRLVDAGCACLLEDAEGSRAGSRGYAAPEQLVINGRSGPESDVYALGKLIIYMSDNKRRWKRFSGGFKRLVEDMTGDEPNCRIPDMRILLQRLSVYGDRINRKMYNRRKTLFYYEKNIRKSPGV